jgi:hypothetical protein
VGKTQLIEPNDAGIAKLLPSPDQPRPLLADGASVLNCILLRECIAYFAGLVEADFEGAG